MSLMGDLFGRLRKPTTIPFRPCAALVSRNVVVQGGYDEKQDLVRAAMETGMLGQAEEGLRVSFGHIGPKQCEMNVDYGKTRTWIEFREDLPSEFF